MKYIGCQNKKDLLIFVHRVRSGIENLSFCGKIIGLATETEDDGEICIWNNWATNCCRSNTNFVKISDDSETEGSSSQLSVLE